MKISVIIPAYNAETTIRETVQSVLNAYNPSIEVIVVDDGSADRTGEILGPYGSALRVIRQENQGVSLARNAGLAVAKGEFCVFLDADDRLMPGMIETGEKVMKNTPDLGALFFSVICFSRNEDGQTTEWDFPAKPRRIKRLGRPPENQWFFLNQNYWPPGAAMIRTAIAREIGGFSKDFQGLADYEFFFRLSGVTKMAAIETVGLHYQIHSGNMSGNKRMMHLEYIRLLSQMRKTGYYSGLSRWRKSIHHMYVAGGVLLYGDIHSAKGELKQAIKNHPGNFFAGIAYLTLKIFGQRSAELFRAIRRLIP